MNARVVTITLNPALDVSCDVDQVVSEHKLRCSEPRFDPGGGGINVARALHRLGVPVRALWCGGGPHADTIAQLLTREGVSHERLEIAQCTRENLTVRELSSGRQYRFGMPGACLSADERGTWLRRVASLDPAPSYLVLSGSLPPGVPHDFYAELIRVAPRRCRIVLDTHEEALREALRARVFLVKPNLRELSQLAGAELLGDDEVEAAARELIATGAAQLVAVSLGRAGALLSSAGGCSRVQAPAVRVRSTIGAGDSMLAGLIAGLVRELPAQEALRLAVAAGSATTLAEGTALFERADVERLMTSLVSHESTHVRAGRPVV